MDFRSAFVAAALVISALGCASNARSNFEVRTHSVAPWQAAEIPKWIDTITTTVAPEKWNDPDSPHRISSDGSLLTIRTTPDNHKKILAFLAQAAQTRAPSNRT